MLSFTIHDLGDVAVFECRGRITVEGGNALRCAVVSHGQAPVVVLDLKEIKDVDAAGLGVLATLKSWAQSKGTELKLMNLMPRVEKALELTGLKSAFAVCSAREMIDLWCRAIHQDLRAASPTLKQAFGLTA